MNRVGIHMMLSLRQLWFAVVIGLVVAAAAFAQSPSVDVKRIAIIRSSDDFAGRVGVRSLRDGRLIVNDPTGRQVLLLDSEFRVASVIADTSARNSFIYGTYPMNLLAFRSDSSVLFDRRSLSMQVLDGNGRFVRTASIPRPSDAAFVANARAGKASFDLYGNLIYRSSPHVTRDAGAGLGAVSDDSAALLRVRTDGGIDTITFVHIPVPRPSLRTDSTGKSRVISEINPLPLVDDWSVLSDGVIGVFRGRDFRLEIFAGMAKREIHKVPYDWTRLNEQEKIALVDSARTRREQAVAAAREQAKIEGRQVAAIEDLSFIPASELPDYFPAFDLNVVLRDPQDRFWVRVLPTTITPNNTFLVIDRNGVVKLKVEISKKYELIDFSNSGGLYLLEALSAPSTATLGGIPSVTTSSKYAIVLAILK